MGVRIVYSCSGCDAFEGVVARVNREVLSSGHMIGGVMCDKVLTHRPGPRHDKSRPDIGRAHKDRQARRKKDRPRKRMFS